MTDDEEEPWNSQEAIQLYLQAWEKGFTPDFTDTYEKADAAA